MDTSKAKAFHDEVARHADHVEVTEGSNFAEILGPAMIEAKERSRATDPSNEQYQEDVAEYTQQEEKERRLNTALKAEQQMQQLLDELRVAIFNFGFKPKQSVAKYDVDETGCVTVHALVATGHFDNADTIDVSVSIRNANIELREKDKRRNQGYRVDERDFERKRKRIA